MVVNLLLVAVLSLGSGFVQTFQQFLGLRSLFGVAMGGIWGLASATALENLPVEARGLASGVLQQGYACGYLIAAVINLYLVPDTTWRSLFWTGAGISAFAAVLRALLPESQVFLRAQEEQRDGPGEPSSRAKTRIFFHEVKQMLKTHWMLCIYAVLLMTGFNFLSHGSQDLYPTYLQASKGFSRFDATVATIIGNCGAISCVSFSLISYGPRLIQCRGGVVAGTVSQHIGRRLTVMCVALHTTKFHPDLILFSLSSASSSYSSEHSSPSGSSQLRSAGSPLVLSASNSAFKGRSRRLVSRTRTVLTIF